MRKPVTLAPKLDLAAAPELVAILRARDDAELVLDMCEVKHMGALCMQIILSAAKTAASENRTIAITNVSDSVTDQLQVMGMTPDALMRGCQ